ncbi:MAG: SDR family NAD(P)-dependent oxidoreductase [Planctomycetota bacterium]
MKKIVKELIELSHYYGTNPDFVLAGGGNTSAKDKKTLWIKGSGTSLATIEESGFVRMDRAGLASLWERKFPANADKREAEVTAALLNTRQSGCHHRRPSVETMMHDLMPQTYVIHTHPALVNGLACGKGGEALCKRLFGNKVLWIPAVNPGFVMSRLVKDRMAEYKAVNRKDASVLILQNHGLVVAADSAAGVKRLSNMVMNTLKKRVKKAMDLAPAPFDVDRAAALAPAIRMLAGAEAATPITTFRSNKAIAGLVKSKKDFSLMMKPFTPDYIVYCNHQPCFVPAKADLEAQYAALEKAIADYRSSNGQLPKLVAVEKLGMFATGAGKKAADTVMELFLDQLNVAGLTKYFGGPFPMTKAKVDFIRNWEAENYRRQVAAGEGGKRLDEKIVIVTGSAQGFGAGIADELAGEGANLVIADLNDELAAQNAEGLVARHGAGKAIAVKTNVGDDQSVQDMVNCTVLEYGGLDLLVSNAGVLRAGGLDEMDIDTFDFMTRINYSAYFLCAKYGCKPMKIQNRFNPESSADIIQVNSKSGLTGSKNNFAYAGSKFGGIGLTQSFALELVEWKIKVNSVCPGNFFSGPLWSDPQRGLFVQYLKAGKVPGAKTVDDVRRGYESKVPMNRGCEVRDVAIAIMYLVEQPYETGQALPVTGGQEMLK